MTLPQIRKQITAAKRAVITAENYYYSIPSRHEVEKEIALNLAVSARFKLDKAKDLLTENTRARNSRSAKLAPKANA